jgi:hypothetical protein
MGRPTLAPLNSSTTIRSSSDLLIPVTVEFDSIAHEIEAVQGTALQAFFSLLRDRS